MMFNGSRGVYTHTVAYEKKDDCVACGSGKTLEVSGHATLDDVLKALVESFPGELQNPSVSHESGNLYLRGVLESAYAKNLTESIRNLCQLTSPDETVMLAVNDQKIKHTMRVRLVFVWWE
jgi:ubiquitin-activating enzyme E1 C